MRINTSAKSSILSRLSLLFCSTDGKTAVDYKMVEMYVLLKQRAVKEIWLLNVKRRLALKCVLWKGSTWWQTAVLLHSTCSDTCAKQMHYAALSPSVKAVKWFFHCLFLLDAMSADRCTQRDKESYYYWLKHETVLQVRASCRRLSWGWNLSPPFSCESSRQSMVWRRVTYRRKKRLKSAPSVGKTAGTIFWGGKAVMNCLPLDHQWSVAAVRKHRQVRMLVFIAFDVLPFHDDARPHHILDGQLCHINPSLLTSHHQFITWWCVEWKPARTTLHQWRSTAVVTTDEEQRLAPAGSSWSCWKWKKTVGRYWCCCEVLWRVCAFSF